MLNDQKGELIGPVIREGREGMPKFDLTQTQITDIANFIHSFKVGGYDVSRMTPPTIVTGRSESGRVVFCENLQRLPFRDRQFEGDREQDHGREAFAADLADAGRVAAAEVRQRVLR